MIGKTPHALALLRAVQEARRSAGRDRPLALGGARELVPLLARELRAGGEEAAVVEWAGKGAGARRRSPAGGGERTAAPAALVWIGAAGGEALRAASRAGTPIVGVTEGESLPYVLDTNLVRIEPGAGLPVEEIARALARALGADGVWLAARLPALRQSVIDELIEASSRRNGLIGAAVFVPGADMPILTLNQVRLVLRIAIASGRELEPRLWPEVLAVVGAGFGFRRVAAELLDLIPVAGWALKGGVALAGTKAVGEAARRRFGSRPDGRDLGEEPPGGGDAESRSGGRDLREQPRGDSSPASPDF